MTARRLEFASWRLTALGQRLEYFAVSEFRAAVLLIGQARQNLYEVMKILAPSYADSAPTKIRAESA